MNREDSKNHLIEFIFNIKKLNATKCLPNSPYTLTLLLWFYTFHNQFSVSSALDMPRHLP